MIERPYQEKTIKEARELAKRGEKRIFIQAPTGAGKTFIFCKFIVAAAEKQKRAAVVVRGRQLVEQASQRLSGFGVEHGVFMASHKGFNPALPIQVCSVDTCISRNVFPKADILVVDEAHLAVSPSYKRFLENYEDSFWLSVSATPWHKDGLKHLASEVIYPISMRELIEQGYLAKPKYYVPSRFDDTEIKIKNGEYDEKETLEAFDRQRIYGDVVREWKVHGVGKASLCFAINLSHARIIAQSFTAGGIRSLVIDASWSLENRAKAIKELEEKKIDVIINVGTMTTGVDIPFLDNIIFCRPTRSKILYTQMVGRGTRVTDTKNTFKIIDHVENVKRHGFIEDEQKSDLLPLAKPRLGVSLQGVRCKKCYFINDTLSIVCEACGEFLSVPRETPVRSLPEIILGTELTEIQYKALSEKEKKDYFDLRAKHYYDIAKARGHKVGSIWMRLVEEFGEEITRQNYRVYRKLKEQYDQAPDSRKRNNFLSW